MNLSEITDAVTQKSNFTTLSDYITFCLSYLDFVSGGLQAVIVSQNENHYRFYQYKEDGHFNISRPINSRLMYESGDKTKIAGDFVGLLHRIRDVPPGDTASREIITRSIYTISQSIGAALDDLPAGKSNTARKLNGDLFERFI